MAQSKKNKKEVMHSINTDLWEKSHKPSSTVAMGMKPDSSSAICWCAQVQKEQEISLRWLQQYDPDHRKRNFALEALRRTIEREEEKRANYTDPEKNPELYTILYRQNLNDVKTRFRHSQQEGKQEPLKTIFPQKNENETCRCTTATPVPHGTQNSTLFPPERNRYSCCCCRNRDAEEERAVQETGTSSTASAACVEAPTTSFSRAPHIPIPLGNAPVLPIRGSSHFPAPTIEAEKDDEKQSKKKEDAKIARLPPIRRTKPYLEARCAHHTPQERYAGLVPPTSSMAIGWHCADDAVVIRSSRMDLYKPVRPNVMGPYRIPEDASHAAIFGYNLDPH